MDVGSFLVGVIVVIILQQVGATVEFGGTHKGWLLQFWQFISSRHATAWYKRK